MNMKIATYLAFILLSWCSNAAKYGFKTCSNSQDPNTKSDDTFTVTYQWGQAVYQCDLKPAVANTLYECETIGATPNNCAPEYGIQISSPRNAPPKVNDVCVQSVIVNGVEIPTGLRRVGDDANGGANPGTQYAYYRYYDLGDGAPSNLPAVVSGVIVNTSEPTCDPVPPLTSTGIDDVFDSNIFQGAGKWYDCPEGYVIGGFYKSGSCQGLHCIENMRCVKPVLPNDITISQECYEENIESAFNTVGTVRCNEGYFVRGIWSSPNDALKCNLYCWETLNCCKYAENLIIVGETELTHDWWTCFDSSTGTRWCSVDDDEFITGFYRSDDKNTGIYELEEAVTRQLYLNASGNSCQAADIATFDWDVLTQDGPAAAGVMEPVVTDFSVNETDLSLNIQVELQYIGKASADDIETPEFGVTYVLDFEDYDAHSDAINLPGTCQNRQAGSYTGKDFVTEYWEYSYDPINDIGMGTSNLAYPPPEPAVGDWSVEMKSDDICGTLIYTGKFTWTDLRNCKQNGGAATDSYTEVIPDDNWLNLTGVFYINLVSPFWYNQDYSFYRVYQLLSQPFVIAVSSVVNVLGSTGINVMTLSVIAVYKEDKETDFRLVLLSECSDYMMLTRAADDFFIFDGSGLTPPNTQIATGDFAVVPTSESGCLNNKGFICSQLWAINAIDIACTDSSGRDFSGNYALGFTPVCRTAAEIGTDGAALAAHCATFLAEHDQLTTGNRVSLSTNLVWRDEICDPQIFVVRFTAEMRFYPNNSYLAPVPDNYLYQVGEDRIYVEVETNYPANTMNVFDTALIEVHICTFNPLVQDSAINDPSDLTNFGCFIGDSTIRDVTYDQYFYKIFDTDPVRNEFGFVVESENDRLVRFSFTVPNEVARDELYVQAEIEVVLESGTTRRRLAGGRRKRPPRGRGNPRATANQMEHFVQSIGINHGQETEPKQAPKEEPVPNNYNPNPPQQYYPPQQPVVPQQPITHPYQPITPVNNPSTWTINLSSPWVITIGGLLGIILTFNIIFMTYSNCCRGDGVSQGRASFMRRGKNKKGYAKVGVDSEYDSEANMIQNDEESQ